jgi:DNA topoisomerase-1
MADLKPAKSSNARKRQLAAVARRVAEVLHNTPAISRKSYIAPFLFELFDDGRLQFYRNANPRAGLRRNEGRLAVLFSEVSE